MIRTYSYLQYIFIFFPLIFSAELNVCVSQYISNAFKRFHVQWPDLFISDISGYIFLSDLRRVLMIWFNVTFLFVPRKPYSAPKLTNAFGKYLCCVSFVILIWLLYMYIYAIYMYKYIAQSEIKNNALINNTTKE